MEYKVCSAGIWYTREREQVIKELEAEFAITDVVQGKFFTPTQRKHRVLYVWVRDSGETQLTVNFWEGKRTWKGI